MWLVVGGAPSIQRTKSVLCSIARADRLTTHRAIAGIRFPHGNISAAATHCISTLAHQTAARVAAGSRSLDRPGTLRASPPGPTLGRAKRSDARDRRRRETHNIIIAFFRTRHQHRSMISRYIKRSLFLPLTTLLAAAALANHPVLVDGNCDSPVPGTTLVTQNSCGDFDGDTRIGSAEDTDGADRIWTPSCRATQPAKTPSARLSPASRSTCPTPAL